MRLSYAVTLSGETIRCAPMYMVLKMHIMERNELKLLSNELSGGGDAYGIAKGRSQLGTLQCGGLQSQRLTDWIGPNGHFYRGIWEHHNMHARGHKNVTTHRHGVWD